MRAAAAALRYPAEKARAASFAAEMRQARNYVQRLPLKALIAIAVVALIVIARLRWLA